MEKLEISIDNKFYKNGKEVRVSLIGLPNIIRIETKKEITNQPIFEKMIAENVFLHSPTSAEGYVLGNYIFTPKIISDPNPRIDSTDMGERCYAVQFYKILKE